MQKKQEGGKLYRYLKCNTLMVKNGKINLTPYIFELHFPSVPSTICTAMEMNHCLANLRVLSRVDQ